MRRKFGAEIELVGGSNGVFDVVVDGRMIFSKFDQKRFPGNEEIINLIREG